MTHSERDGVRLQNIGKASSHLAVLDQRQPDSLDQSHQTARDELIRRMRKFMVERPFYDFTRKDFAVYAGVDHNLVSLYFPSKIDLIFEASSEPVIAYSNKVQMTLSGSADKAVKLRSIIGHFVELGLMLGYTIEYFVHAVGRRNRPEELAALARQYIEINTFFEQLALQNSKRIFNAAFLQSSIWGQCLYLSRQPHLARIADKAERDTLAETISEDIFDLLTKGLPIEGSAGNSA